MFFKSKKNSQPQCDLHAFAVAAIDDELEQAESERGLAFVHGMAEMAYTLGAITLNERAAYTDAIYQKQQEIKAAGQPIYKKKGVYEYRGYYLLKDLAADAKGDGAAVWCVKKIGETGLIETKLTFTEACRRIDTLANQ